MSNSDGFVLEQLASHRISGLYINDQATCVASTKLRPSATEKYPNLRARLAPLNQSYIKTINLQSVLDVPNSRVLHPGTTDTAPAVQFAMILQSSLMCMIMV